MTAQINAHIGHNLRQLRHSSGLSQTAFADLLGVSFQQVQKYEKGHNRLPIDKLYILHSLLHVPLDDFFIGVPLPARVLARQQKAALKTADTVVPFVIDRLKNLKDRKRRRQIIEIIDILSRE